MQQITGPKAIVAFYEDHSGPQASTRVERSNAGLVMTPAVMALHWGPSWRRGRRSLRSVRCAASSARAHDPRAASDSDSQAYKYFTDWQRSKISSV
jgi:hypothetical protein